MDAGGTGAAALIGEAAMLGAGAGDTDVGAVPAEVACIRVPPLASACMHPQDAHLQPAADALGLRHTQQAEQECRIELQGQVVRSGIGAH